MKVKVSQSRPTLCDPVDYTVHGILQARILEWVHFPFSRESSQPRDWTQASHFAGRFFTSWATRGAQEYWSLSLLQGIFLTQELNRGLLHGRWILYQLNYEGSWKTYKLAILEDLQTSFPSSMREARISYKYTYIPSLNFPPNPLGCYRAQGWAPCVIQQLPTSYLFYIW